ncbi:oligosaccharide flippase family protein [Anaerotardibacter muris]|uniref:oligosaccharide flippase family protein n=1 Tax=Anaerotardibacter muris TaxID=2941505 RepID=UPI00203B4450|nr:oligosaccharide flippase family protein [Anaerotardibacter muris]
MSNLKPNSLLKNTSMLFLLTASNYIFGFASIPYLTRVLGPETYGIIGVAMAVYTFMQLFLDFGFILSATGEVASNRDCNESIEQTLSSVTGAKAVLIISCGVILAILCLSVEMFREQWILYMLFFAYAAINSLIPDFLYRGIERMEIVTIRTVIIKAVFLVCIFIFIRSASDYLLVPVFYLMGALGALVAVFWHVRFRMRLRLRRTSLISVVNSIKKSAEFFFSRIASTIYTYLNTVILGVMFTNSSGLGLYSAADRAIVAGKSVSSPIADSMYPYMMRKRNNRLLVTIAFVGGFALLLICIPCWIFSTEICLFVFGEEYGGAGPILRLLLPLIPISLLTYLFGFPALTPFGKASIANRSVVYGAILHCVQLAFLFYFGMVSIESICIATVITESFVLVIRALAYFVLLASNRENGSL